LPKFCPNCGAKLKFPEAKFCHDCGFVLVPEFPASMPTVPHIEPIEEESLRTSVAELGSKFEDVVEKILQADGYQTERRKRIEGKSGTRSEIDIIANKPGRTVIVECKNYAEPVGIDKVRDFTQKLRDIGPQWKGIFVSYNGFTTDAAQLAQYHNIETWSGDEISEKWLAVSVGRLTSHQGQYLTVEYALPLNISFTQATRLDHVNKDKIKATHVELIYHPYFAIEYHFKAQVRDPTKELHKFEDRGTLYIDALDCHILNSMPEKGLGILKKALTSLVSKKARLQNERSEKLLSELQHNKPSREYSISIEDEYTVIKLKPLATPNEAVRTSIDFVTEENTVDIEYSIESKDDSYWKETRTTTYVPKRQNIRIIRKDIVVIPRWSIDFESFGTSYKKEILACSDTPLEDTLSYCPWHFKIGALTITSRKAIAVCEVCGKSLCEDHVKRCPLCNKWLCEEHGSDCEVCGNRFCSQHITLSCPVCGRPVCEACATACPICNRKYSRNHAVRCDNCGTLVCPGCVTTKGLIRRTSTCKKCLA
jgi:hypothetical protein